MGVNLFRIIIPEQKITNEVYINPVPTSNAVIISFSTQGYIKWKNNNKLTNQKR